VQLDILRLLSSEKDCYMRRSWILVLSLALLMTLVSSDVASAKKSRSKSSSSSSHGKREARRGRSSRALSRREKRGPETIAVRGKRGRRLARGRGRARYESQPIVASGAPRPAPGIPPERVTEIQNALIKAGYMDGPASGLYDDSTIEAMKGFQARNGMSQTGLPSAPLLKKLGVPKRSNDGYAVPVNSVSETDKKRPGNEKPEF
jgi:hypothetical protein